MENLIPAEVFCNNYHIEVSFLHSLGEYGLIEITERDEVLYIKQDQLQSIERYLRLHFDLEINLEGIEAIKHMRDRMDEMEKEITALRNRLKRYENV